MTKEEMDEFLVSIGGLQRTYREYKGPIIDARCFGVGEGWYSIIRDLINELIALGWDKRLVQCKEKFGGLRFYLETYPEGAKSFSEKGALKLFEKGKAVMSQVKADGTYRNAIIRSGEVELISRQGEVSTLPGAKFLLELSQFEDCVLNGELTIDGVKRTIANGMVTSIMDIFEKEDERGEVETAKKVAAFEEKHGPMVDALAKLRFTVWDMITVDEYFAFKSDTEYHERFNTLRKRLEVQSHEQVDLIETRFIRTYEEAMEHFLDTQKRGLEGTIIKDSHAGWKDGKPTYQIKMKLEMDMDLRIVGFKYGNKGTKNETVISVLELESECGKLKTAPAGMTEAMMADVTARQEELLGTVVQIYNYFLIN